MKKPRPFDPDDSSTVPLVELMSAGPAIHAHQIHRAWRGMVQAPGSLDATIPVALKFMPSPVKLSIELACSLAAHALKLPVPRGMLVVADPQDLPGFPVDQLPESRRRVVCYGSVLRWPEDTAERILPGTPGAEDYVWHRLCQTKAAAPGAVWDELVANDDRHVGNFIFDGARYWFIDHELALRPLAAMVRKLADATARQTLLDHRSKVNQVASQLRQRRPDDHNMFGQVPIFAARKRALEALVTYMPQWRTGQPHIDNVFIDAETIVRGIILRLPALGLYLNDRLANPCGPLMWNSASAQSTSR